MKKREKREMGHLFFSKKIPDPDGLAGVCDIGIDGEMSIIEPHLLTVTVGDTDNEILNVAKHGANGGRGLFLEPNQASIISFHFPVSSLVMRSKSKFRWLKLPPQ